MGGTNGAEGKFLRVSIKPVAGNRRLSCSVSRFSRQRRGPYRLREIQSSPMNLAPAGAQLYGLDPAARFARVVDIINRDHRGVAFVVIAGDLVHSGDRAAYEVFRTILKQVHAPAILLMGNHDGRASFRAVFPNADDDGNGYVQSVRTLDAATLITIAEWQVFQRTRMPDFMFFGHIHRPAAGIWRGVPFHIQRATSHQGRLRSDDIHLHSGHARVARLFFGHRYRQRYRHPSALVSV